MKRDKKKTRRIREETYSIYICKVEKQIDPHTGISSKAMLIINSFVNDIFERNTLKVFKLTLQQAFHHYYSENLNQSKAVAD